MADWPVHEGFVDMLDACLRDGPQVLTRNGKAAAVLVSFEEWKLLRPDARYDRSVLLAPEPRLDDLMTPEHGWMRCRPFDPTMFDD